MPLTSLPYLRRAVSIIRERAFGDSGRDSAWSSDCTSILNPAGSLQSISGTRSIQSGRKRHRWQIDTQRRDAVVNLQPPNLPEMRRHEQAREDIQANKANGPVHLRSLVPDRRETSGVAVERSRPGHKATGGGTRQRSTGYSPTPATAKAERLTKERDRYTDRTIIEHKPAGFSVSPGYQ